MHTFLPLLENCINIQSLRKLHASIITHGLQNSIYLGSKLLNSYAEFGSLTDSRAVFHRIINRNLSLWTSISIGYFRTGYFSEVLRLYSCVKREGIGYNSSTFTFAFKSCTELESSKIGQGIHGDALKLGLSADRFVASSLIGLYSICGSMQNAQMVFDEMSERDLVAYTAIITGYAEATMTDDSYNSFRILGLMQNEGFSPNRVTLVSLIRAATKIGALFEVKSIHCFALRRGVGHGDEIFETSLIDGYVKCGALEITGAIFSGVGKRNVGSWNVIISGYVQYGNPLRALNFFHFMMIERNLKPDLISLANALLGCADLMCLSLGASIHGYIIRREIDLDLIAATALIEMYGKCRKIEKAKEVFDTVKFKDVVSCNVMIGAYLHSGLTEQAFGVLSLVRETGMRFNTATMLNLLSACANLTDIQRGRQLHGCVVKYGFGSDLEVCNQMVDMYAKCGCLDLARKFLDGMREKDLVSWVSMMMGYVNFGHADKAIAVFQMMQLLRGEKPDSVTIIALLQALSQLGSSRKVKEVHGCVYKLGLERESSIINSLIFTYAKCGKLEASEALFKNMEESDLASWNSMIGAYKSHGNCLKALELLNMMRERRIRPDEVTFTSILSACSHVGLVEEGWKIFYSMIDEYSMTPCEEHYGCMVDLLGRAGHLEEAYSFIRSVPLLQKSTSTLGALLGACRIHGNVKMGEVVASQLLSLEPENSGTYTLLSNIYADAGQWRSAERLRTSARERGLKKIPGYSLTN